MTDYKRGKNSYDFNQYDYNLIDDVYNNIKDNSRVIFIIRHAERGPDWGQEGGLTKNGIRQAKSLGKRLSGGKFKNTKTDFYGSTIYKRTPQTSYYVGYGRKYRPFLNDTKSFKKSRIEYEKIFNTIDVIDPSYLTSDMSLQEIERKSGIVAKYLCNLTEGHPFCFITSHDTLLMPIITWVTKGSITFTRETRINYLSGIAIIVNDTSKEWEVYPIHTLKEKSMILND